MTNATTKRVSFSGTGGGRLSGSLHLPGGPPQARLVLSHCFTCNKDYKILVRLGRALSCSGVAALRFDYVGLGQSAGRFEEATVSRYVADLKAAVGWMQAELPHGPIVLAGHSMGGAVSILTAAELPSIRGVATIATSSDLTSLHRLLHQLQQQRPEKGPVEVAIGGKSYPISQEFLQDLKSHSLRECLLRLQCPYLALHGTDDSTTGIEHGEKLFAAARQPKAFFSIPGAGHLLDRPPDAELAAQILTLWIQRIVAADASTQLRPA